MRAVTASIIVTLAVAVSSAASAQDFSGLRPAISPDRLVEGDLRPLDGLSAPEDDEEALGSVRVGAFTLHTGFSSGHPASSNNDTAFTAQLRAGYAAAPAATAFVESRVSQGLFDQGFVENESSSAGIEYSWRAGVAFDRHAMAGGEVAIGYAERYFDDPASATLRALTFDGSLVWAPSALTMITLTGTTSLGLGSSLTPGPAVALDGSLGLAYAWRRNVTLMGSAAARRETYQGTGLVDTNYTAGFSATWKMNQTHRFTAGYEHEWQESSDPSRAYQSDAVRVELRMQR